MILLPLCTFMRRLPSVRSFRNYPVLRVSCSAALVDMQAYYMILSCSPEHSLFFGATWLTAHCGCSAQKRIRSPALLSLPLQPVIIRPSVCTHQSPLYRSSHISLLLI